MLVLGLDNAGKTTLLEKIKSMFLGVPGLPPEKITPTIGLNSKLSIEEREIKLIQTNYICFQLNFSWQN